MARPMPRPPPVTSATLPSSPLRPPLAARLPTRELRRALLEERGQRLTHVAGVARQQLRAVLEVDGGLEAPGLQVAPHDLLRHPYAERAVGADELGGLQRGVDDVAVGHDARHEPDAVGLAGLDHAAGQHQLERARGADQAREQVADADVAAGQADADEATLKRALSAATRTSHASASARPPPLAGPFTAAITGFGRPRSCVTSD